MKTPDEKYAACRLDVCQLSLKIDSGGGKSCTINTLETNLTIDTVTTISGQSLGSCGGTDFDLSSETLSLTLNHKGNDGWTGDWVKIFVNDQFVVCHLGGVIMKEGSGSNDPTGYKQYSTKCSSLEDLQGRFKLLLVIEKNIMYLFQNRPL